MGLNDDCPSLEVLIPVYNEEAMIGPLIERLESVFSARALEESKIKSVHYHFIDDGSRDLTPRKIFEAIERGVPATLHVLSRNFGHQSSVTAGIDASEADLVAVIDGDLQDPPELILEMVSKWREGIEVVYGIRTKRKESFLKVWAYWIFYRILAFLSEVEIPRDSGDFCLMDKRVVDALKRLPETLRFPRGLRAWVGFRQCGIAYERGARQKGESKYTVRLLYRLATDGIASMSIRALNITQFFTFLFAIVSLGLSFFAVRLLVREVHANHMAVWFVSGFLLNSMIGFIVMFSLYIMSAYIGRTYLEVKRRPAYITREVVKSGSVRNSAEKTTGHG